MKYILTAVVLLAVGVWSGYLTFFNPSLVEGSGTDFLGVTTRLVASGIVAVLYMSVTAGIGMAIYYTYMFTFRR